MASSANQNEIEYLLNNKGIFALNINLNLKLTLFKFFKPMLF